MKDVITINRDDASRACAKAIKDLQIPDNDVEFYVLKLMELSVFGAMVVSNLFKDMEEQNDEENVSVNN